MRNLQNDERRQASRHPVQLDAHYDSPAILMQGRVTNLSQSGLFVRSDFLDGPGTLVSLAIQFPSELAPMRLVGLVARVDSRPRKSGMGIQFTDLSDACQARLARHIKDDDSERPSSVASAI